MKMINKFAVLPLLAAAIVFGSCQRDAKVDSPEVPDGGDPTEVSFRLDIPVNRAADTRALVYADEYKVEEVDLIVFENGMYSYTSHGVITTDAYAANDGSDAQLVFEAHVQPSVAHVDMMAVANAGDMIQGLEIGTAMEEIVAGLGQALPAGGWVADPTSTSYASMPMWGWMKDLMIDKAFFITDHTIGLVRMLARVNVKLAPSLTDPVDIADSKFRLKSVKVFNFAKSGRLIPDLDGVFDWSAVPVSGMAGALVPSMPAGVVMSDGENEYLDYAVTDDKSLVNNIYIFEAPAGVNAAMGSEAHIANPCIVVGGLFDGATTESFYRVDFANKNAVANTIEFLPVLRNNSYTVGITDVSGLGWPTPEQAYNSVPENIRTSVVNWNNNDFSTIISDGVHILAIDGGPFILDQQAHLGLPVNIMTNMVGGWKAGVFADKDGNTVLAPSWITLSQTSGDGNYDQGNYDQGNPITFDVDPLTGDQPRTAWIVIEAGGYKHAIQVTQNSPQPDPFVRVTDMGGVDLTEPGL